MITLRTGATLLITGLVGLSAAACATSTATPAATEQAPASAAAPGASGTIAAVTGNSLEVQNPQAGQVTVQVGDSTTITSTVAATAADLAVNDCVMVTSSPADASGTAQGAPVAATAVTISPASGQGCRPGGPGGGNRTRPSGTNPPAAAGGGNGGDNGNGGGNGGGRGRDAFGTVSAVSADGFTVQPGGNGSAPVTVTTTASTTYTKTVAANAAALVVGQCATAFGTADDTGTIAATSVSVRPPGTDGCTAFAGGGRGGQDGNGQGGGAAGNGSGNG